MSTCKLSQERSRTLRNDTVGGKRHIIELCKVRTDMMLVSSRTNLTAIQISASAHILINL